MRWLILGPYPPEQGLGAQATARAAIEHIDAGQEVTVISPRPTAAHRHQVLAGREALWALGSSIGADTAVWARVEPGVLLTRTTDRRTALLERLLLRRLLRRAGRSVLDVGDLDLFPGGRAGALVFDAVDQLVVHSAVDRDRLLEAGAPARKVVVIDRPKPPAGPAATSTPPSVVDGPPPAPPDQLRALAAGATREEIEAAVRARAAAAPVRSADRR